MALRGGLVYRTRTALEEARWFLPDDVVVRVTMLAASTTVPGTRAPAAGIALADGEVVTVLAIGDREDGPPVDEDGWPMPGAAQAVLCDVGGERVALTGGTVVATGWFDAAGQDHEGVTYRGAIAPTLDVRALRARAEAAIWAARATASRRGGELA